MQGLFKRFEKKNVIIAVILISIGVIAGVIISSNLGWIPLGQAKVEPIPPRITEQLAETEKAFVEIAKRVTPAVVNISTTKTMKGMEKGQLSPFFNDPFFRRFFGDEFFREHEMPRKRKEQSLGICRDCETCNPCRGKHINYQDNEGHGKRSVVSFF